MAKKIFLSRFCEILYHHICSHIDSIETHYCELESDDYYGDVYIRKDRDKLWYAKTTRKEPQDGSQERGREHEFG